MNRTRGRNSSSSPPAAQAERNALAVFSSKSQTKVRETSSLARSGLFVSFEDAQGGPECPLCVPQGVWIHVCETSFDAHSLVSGLPLEPRGEGPGSLRITYRNGKRRIRRSGP